MNTLRARLTIILSVLMVSLAGEAAAQVLQRKNIDRLTVRELAAYEHAIQILKDRSAANPYDETGYLWQAWVHNCTFIWRPASGVGAPGSHGDDCDSAQVKPGPDFVQSFPGVCEHRKDLFLVWHRAQFYYFEKLLQSADPIGAHTDSQGHTGPATLRVTIPYWNWTRPPSGVRYPKALERIGSSLYHAKRNHNALTPPERDFLAKVTSPIAIAALVYDADWRDFGGFPQEAPIGGYGQFESAHHNPMHNDYFGGDMEDQSRAALDPGFFSFHAYIDLLFQFWLDQHGPQSVTSQSHFLRATQPAKVTPAPGHTDGAGLPSMGQAGIYLDAARLGYGYEVTDEDRLPNLRALAAVLYHVNGVLPPFGTTEKSRHALLSGDGLFDPRRGPATAIANVALRIPAQAVTTYAAFERPHDAPDVNFDVDFYLHPSDPAFDLAQKTERERYIVVSLGHFGSGTMADHGAHGADKPLYADLTPALKDLAATGHAGESWTLTAVVSGPAPQPTFGSLSHVP